MSLLLLLTGGAAPTTGGFASPVLAPLTIGSVPGSATGGFSSPILAPLTIGAVPATARPSLIVSSPRNRAMQQLLNF